MEPRKFSKKSYITDIQLGSKYASGDSVKFFSAIILFIFHIDEIIARGFDFLVIHSNDFHSHPRENK